jgi:UDP-2-acetamido-2-deoxy-ribo-hexuluronate aminotransferase
MNKIPFIDLQSQYQAYKEEILKEMHEVLDSSQYIMGPKVQALEEALAEYVGVKHTLSCASGTDALLLSLMALNLQPGDEVIVPAFTFYATAEVVSFLGAKPVFVDIDPRTYNMDPEKISAAVTEKTRVLMPVSLFGQTGPMEEYLEMAHKHGLTMIEDGAQSFGAEYQGKRSPSFGALGTTSFFPAKPLGGYGEGGAVFTDDGDLYQKLQILRNHGQTQRYIHSYVGINGRLDALQAAILLVKLRHYNQEMNRREELARNYQEGLKDLEGIQLPVVEEGRRSAFAQYTIQVDHREEFLKDLGEKGVPLAVHYPMALFEQPVYQHMVLRTEDFPVTSSVRSRVVSLPFSAFLKEKDQDRIIQAIREWLKQKQ